MRDLLSIHVGQCGVQLGADLWQNVLFEEGLDLTGTPPDRNDDLWNHDTFFEETSTLTYTPRALFIDSDPQAIDDNILSGPFKSLVSDRNVVTGKESASGVYSRAKYYIAKRVSTRIMHALRRVVERCESLDSIYSYSSVSGGTGSGLMTFVNSLVKDVIPKVQSYHHALFPSVTLDTGTLAPYNAIMHLAEARSTCDLRCIYNNEAIYGLLDPLMPDRSPDITYSDMNYLIALVPRLITRGVRTQGKLTVNLDSSDHLMNNLVPFPALNNVCTAVVPLNRKSCSTAPSLVSITSEAFLNHQEMCDVDIHNGRYVACCLHYCGEINVKECHDTVADIRSEFHVPFVDWVPTGFKITMDPEIVSHPPNMHFLQNSPLSMLKISNHTSIAECVNSIVAKYDKLLEERAFVWWYISEGMEEGEFLDAKETVMADQQQMFDAAKDVVMEDE